MDYALIVPILAYLAYNGMVLVLPAFLIMLLIQ